MVLFGWFSLGRKVARTPAVVANKVSVESWLERLLLAGNVQFWLGGGGGGCAVGSAVAGVRDV